MAISLRIEPGNPLWNSDALRIRRTQESNMLSIGAHQSPYANSDFWAYVKVGNTGTDPAAAPACPATGRWSPVDPMNSAPKPPNQDVVANASLGRSALVINGNPTNIDFVTLGAVWGWSPGGRYFAFLERRSGAAWATVYDTQPTQMQANLPPVVVVGTMSFLATGVGAANFGFNAAGNAWVWAVASATGGPASDGVACLDSRMTGGLARTFSPGLTSSSGVGPLVFSPCGGLAALIPFNVSAGSQLRMWSCSYTSAPLGLDAAQPYEPRSGNAWIGAVTVNAAGATITSNGSGLNGLQLAGMSRTTIDNPERLLGTGVVVETKAVASTTTPSAAPLLGMGGRAITAITAITAIMPGSSLWVECAAKVRLPHPPAGEHYCLTARADASAATPAPGDAAPPWSAFSATDRHFAQRNIGVI